MRYKHKLWFLFLVFFVCSAGSGKENTLMGVPFGQVESCKIYHSNDEKDIDLTSEDGKKFLKVLSEFFENNRNRMGIVDYDIGLKWPQLKKFASKTENKDSYYIFFQFSNQQTIKYTEKQSLLKMENMSEERRVWKDCDGLLFNVEAMLISCSKNEEFFGTLEINYADVAWDRFSEVYETFMSVE